MKILKVLPAARLPPDRRGLTASWPLSTLQGWCNISQPVVACLTWLTWLFAGAGAAIPAGNNHPSERGAFAGHSGRYWSKSLPLTHCVPWLHRSPCLCGTRAAAHWGRALKRSGASAIFFFSRKKYARPFFGIGWPNIYRAAEVQVCASIK